MTTGTVLLPRNHHLSTCLSGELEILKSPTSSSTLSTGSSAAAASPRSVATRKPRTPRKRPNQTYNEAAALLSASYPNLFHSPKTLAGLPFLLRREDDDRHLLFSPPPPPPFSPRLHRSSSALPAAAEQPDSDFDAESLLEEDAGAGGGIDTIMGGLVDSGDGSGPPPLPVGLGLGIAALRRDSFGGEAGNWWCFPLVDMVELSPRLTAKQKKAKPKSESPEKGLSLKLNYDGVLRAWSGKGSPFSVEGLAGQNDDVAVGPTSANKSSKSKKKKQIYLL